MIDVSHQISAVRRRVGTREFKAGEARVVTVSQAYDSTVEDVWDACTNPERIPRWFLPVSGELRLGGRYQLEGNAGGTVERCDPPKEFTATWEYGGEVSWIEVRITAEGEGRARFVLEHIAHVDDERWAEFGPGAVGIGWDMGLIGLALHLSTGAAVDSQEAMAWMGTDEGRRFVTLSGEGWYEAAVTDGDEAGAARAAADRTIAAYTGAGAEAEGGEGTDAGADAGAGERTGERE
ncbi:SRPBCC family protein [Streptomyces sp. CA-210063]|uniref:SRPBCC family protein n=1 Tax=Streptomyces sp. CA-210063 TaxID=2801029 RepID=UPI00214C259D|nr:SRPBCC family protein [Streptomyces sp. CA-210063]UUU32859.1 SRPBCC family protein [Streptomyces sp. CA-210063]